MASSGTDNEIKQLRQYKAFLEEQLRQSNSAVLKDFLDKDAIKRINTFIRSRYHIGQHIHAVGRDVIRQIIANIDHVIANLHAKGVARVKRSQSMYDKRLERERQEREKYYDEIDELGEMDPSSYLGFGRSRGRKVYHGKRGGRYILCRNKQTRKMYKKYI